MPRYEYKVVPAPTKGLKAKGVRTPEARFSNAIQSLMNQLAGDGWEYQRAETLPSVERSGLTSTTTEWRNVLVFRRPREDDVEAFSPELLPAPDATPMPAPATSESSTTSVAAKGQDDAEAAPQSVEKHAAETAAPPAERANGAATDPDATKTAETDNGVEDTGDIRGIGASLDALAKSRKSSGTDD